MRLITRDTFIAGADNADSYSAHLYPSQVEEALKGIMYDEKQPDRMGSLSVVGYQEVVKFLLTNFGMDLSDELVFLTLEKTYYRAYTRANSNVYLTATFTIFSIIR